MPYVVECICGFIRIHFLDVIKRRELELKIEGSASIFMRAIIEFFNQSFSKCTNVSSFRNLDETVFADSHTSMVHCFLLLDNEVITHYHVRLDEDSSGERLENTSYSKFHIEVFHRFFRAIHSHNIPFEDIDLLTERITVGKQLMGHLF